MLSLFKDPAQEPPGDGITRARELLVSWLNKGVIPTWEEFFLELPSLDSAEELEAIKENFLRVTRWPFLEEILETPATEFFFHSPGSSQRLRYDGQKEQIPIPLSEEEWQLWLETISLKFHQNWNVENPFVSFYGDLFGKSYRLSLIHGSSSPVGRSKLILRSLAPRPHDLTTFGETAPLCAFVREKKNILIAGSTGSGKTSLLTSLLSLISPEEHLVILEDTYEILCEHPHQTRFLSGTTPQTSLKSYLAYSLRLSPDRILLGEVRSHEIVPFLMAMNTGHKGLMGTIHASSAADALHRAALLFSLYGGEANLNFERVMELLCRNLEYVVFMENKKVKEVIKVLGSENGVPFFETTQSFDGAEERLNF